MHRCEARIGRWLIRKGFWKEIALPSGSRQAMKPSCQGRVDTCCSWCWGQDRTSAKATRQAVQTYCLPPQDSKSLVASNVSLSLFSSVKNSKHRIKENFSVYLLSPGTTFWFHFLWLNMDKRTHTWQLHGSWEHYHNHGLLKADLEGSYFYYVDFIWISGS